MRDFSATTIRRLLRKGIVIVAPRAIPDMTSAMPYANAERGWLVNDNGTARIWTFAQVQEAAR
jgi:hypothetical protein